MFRRQSERDIGTNGARFREVIKEKSLVPAVESITESTKVRLKMLFAAAMKCAYN